MAVEADYHPGFLEDQDVRKEEAKRAIRAAVDARRDNLVWLLSGPKGRKFIRHQLIQAKAWPGRLVQPFIANYGQLAYRDGERARGFEVLDDILVLLVNEKLTLESFQKLMTETDE